MMKTFVINLFFLKSSNIKDLRDKIIKINIPYFKKQKIKKNINKQEIKLLYKTIDDDKLMLLLCNT